ncbi:MAG: 3-keto-5-aminohexanoate cleavage protein [Myxococcota bacterium]
MARPDSPVILEAAINGMTSKEKNPNALREPEEIVREASPATLGATIVHAHNSDIALAGDEAARDCLRAWRPILEARPDALWYPTLTASPDMAGKLAHIEQIAREDSAAHVRLDPGSTNIGAPGPTACPSAASTASPTTTSATPSRSASASAWGPPWGIYEPNALRTTPAWQRAGKLPAGSMVKLYWRPLRLDGDDARRELRPRADRVRAARLPRHARGVGAALVGLGLGRAT